MRNRSDLILMYEKNVPIFFFFWGGGGGGRGGGGGGGTHPSCRLAVG